MVKVFNSYKIVCGNFDWKKHQRTKAPLINLRNKKCPPELVKSAIKEIENLIEEIDNNIVRLQTKVHHSVLSA